jgi:NitT/TauT family transport system substrate-binding protein
LTATSFGSVAAQDSVSVILQWVPQAQFAGYYAADELGYWDELGLDVELIPSGPDVVPQVVGSDPNGPEFTETWTTRVLDVVDAGQSDLVNIGQVFQRSGTTSVSWADNPVNSPAEFAGKKVGVWDFGNEFEVTAAATQAGLTAGEDYEKVIQPFDMALLLNREIDVAEAMTYNEYAQVLETINPDTGELYTNDDLVIIDYNEVGTAMLQDAIHARASWLAEPGNEDIATRFLAGAYKGWIYCRDHHDECVQFTLNQGPTIGQSHQDWQLNEVNALIWPSPDGIGAMSEDAWANTQQIMLDSGIIENPSPEGAYRTDLTEAAWELLEGEDLVGADFEKRVVEIVEGGE